MKTNEKGLLAKYPVSFSFVLTFLSQFYSFGNYIIRFDIG